MPVPTTLSDLSTTIGSNYPTGGETVGTNMDDYLRAHAGLIAQVNNNKQDADADLTAIAALSPTNDDILQRKSGAWTNRTIAQLKTDLAYGTAANYNVGTSANNVVQLDGSAKLPAVDGSQLTGLPTGVTQGTAQTPSSGTSLYFTIPSSANMVTLTMASLVMSGSAPIVRVGTTSAAITTGYKGNLLSISGSSANASALSSGLTFNSPSLESGAVTFHRVSGNIWAFNGGVSREASGSTDFFFGSVDLGAALGRIYVVSADGSATFTGGTLNVQYA